ncbi:MAG: hypothetical protein NVS9B7_09350 [Flavisolibacter sp.]
MVYYNPESSLEEVHVFYEINKREQQFFIFSEGSRKNKIAEVLLKALRKKVKNLNRDNISAGN